MHQAVQYLNMVRNDAPLLHAPGKTHNWGRENQLQGLIMIILGAVPSQVQNLGNKVSDKKTAALTLTCNRYSSVYFFKHPNFEIIPWEHIGLSWAHYTPYSQASPSLLSSICPLKFSMLTSTLTAARFNHTFFATTPVPRTPSSLEYVKGGVVMGIFLLPMLLPTSE